MGCASTKPSLEHVVETLETVGITEIIIVVGHDKERIQNHFGSGGKWDIGVQYVTQERPLRTDDALLQADSLVGEEFLAMTGDRIVEPAVLEQLAKQREQTGRNHLTVTRVRDPLLRSLRR